MADQDSCFDTLSWYDERAEDYAARTREIDTRGLIDLFAAHVPPGARVLDAGCGSGRDSLEFLRRGYDVEAYDASRELASIASKAAGIEVWVMKHQALDMKERYAGIFASATLLHVPLDEMAGVFARLHRALRPGGVLFASFKEGEGESTGVEGRRFTNFTTRSLKRFVDRHTAFDVAELIRSPDIDGREGTRWVTAVLRRPC